MQRVDATCGGLDAAVARTAETQHGLITLTQLRDLGARRSHIRTRVARGQWVVLAPAVLRIAGAPVTWESKVLAAVLDGGGPAMASHRAAAALWGLPQPAPPDPEITVPRSRNLRRRGVTVHRSSDLHLVAPEPRCGIPTTPIGRTLLDLGAVAPRDRVESAIHSARRQGLIGWSGLLDTLIRHARRGRDGVAALRAALDRNFDAVVRTPGGFEKLVLILLRNAGLPEASLDHEVTVDGRPLRLPLALPPSRLAIHLETDDQPEPGDPPGVAERLRTIGWSVVRFDGQSYLRRSGEMVRQIRAAGQAQAARPTSAGLTRSG